MNRKPNPSATATALRRRAEARLGKRRKSGLFSVCERLGLLGGQMEIDSAPGRGSRFTLWVPLGQPVVRKTRGKKKGGS